MNNANGQRKSRSEVGFPMKESRTSPLYSSRLSVELINCLLDWKGKTNKYEWCKRWIASVMKVKTQVQAIELE